MEQDDEELEQLLGEIPRATSAPPHLEELQRAYGGELNNSPFVVSSVGEAGQTHPPVKPFIDIRCDEQYENFYRAYSGAKKLPRPMENRSLYAEFPNSVSPKANSNHLSPFFSGLALDSPRSMSGLRSRQKQQDQISAQISSQISAQISSNNNNSTNNSVRTVPTPPKSGLSGDDHALSSAFGNLTFEESALSGRHLEESGVGGENRGASNGGLDHGNGMPNGIPTALYCQLNPFSAGFGPESASLVEAFVNRSPSITMDLFSQKSNAVPVTMDPPSNGAYASYDGQATQVFEKFLRLSNPSVENHSFSSLSPRPRNPVIADGFGNDSISTHGDHLHQHQQQQYEAAYTDAAYAAALAAASAMNGHDLYDNGEMEYTARALQRQGQQLQMQLDSEQRARERQFQQQIHQQQQQMRFYASLQAQAQAQAQAQVNGSNSYPSSRGHSPTEASVARGGKNSRNHEQLWNVRGGEAFRISVANSICRYYAQGYCSRGDACPFLHSPTQTYGRGGASSFKDERLLVEKMLPRPRMGSRTSNASAIPAAHHPGQRRKPEVLANGNSLNGIVYSNGNHHPCPVSFHGDVLSQMEESMGAQHLSPQSQQAKYNTLEEVEGRIFSIAKDQHGCRFLQRKFDEGGADDVQKIFQEIIEHIIELMTDPFGNYLVQKLLEVCNESQRMEILQAVTGKGELVTISLNMHGTRAVQKLIETLKSVEQVSMVIVALKQGVVTLIKDLNGNHVIQRCLQKLSTEDSQFIFDAAAVHCVEIATHRHGCCVLQRCVDFASGAQRHCLVAEIAANALVLSQDPFGNYVVQYILDLGLTWASVEVMVRLENHYPYLAMQKFSSNVVEKCLKLATDENRGRIVRELMGSPRLGQMLQDPYANYVVQSALTVAKGSLHAGLVEAIRPHLSVLRSSPYGKRILSRTNLKK